MVVKRQAWACGLLLAAAVAGCSPDDPSMGSLTYTPEQIQQGVQYKVEVDQTTNMIHCESLVATPQCLWVTPSGRSQAKTVDFGIAFAGDYEVQFGLETPGGYVYGAPFKFTLAGTNASLIEGDFWTFLAGSGDDGKVWMPLDQDYGFTTFNGCADCYMPKGPITMFALDNVLNDGSGDTDYKYGHIKENWGPGYSSDWYGKKDADENDAYDMTTSPFVQQSTMTFSVTQANGAKMKVHEVNPLDGTATDREGIFDLILGDPDHPYLKAGCEILKSPLYSCQTKDGFKNPMITFLNEDFLQVAMVRNGGEGDCGEWGLIFTYVAQKVRNGEQEVTQPEIGGVAEIPVTMPTFPNIQKDLYSTSIGTNAVELGTTTWLINEEKPYDWMWWNPAVGVFQSVVGDSYDKFWKPAMDQDQIDNFEFVMEQKTDNDAVTNTFEFGSVKGTIEIGEDGLIGLYNADGTPMDLTIFDVVGDRRVVKLDNGESAFQLLSCQDDAMQFGIPVTQDKKGANDCYLVVNLVRKQEGGATGPVAMKIDDAKLKAASGAPDANPDNWKNAYRLVFQPYNNPDAAALDLTKLKVKKNQILRIKFKLSGFGFSADAKPKAALGFNEPKPLGGEEFGWEPSCFEEGAKDNKYLPQIDFKEGQDNEFVIVNETGSTITFPTANNSFQVCIQTCEKPGDTTTSWLDPNMAKDDKGNPDLSTIKIESVSITIEEPAN